MNMNNMSVYFVLGLSVVSACSKKQELPPPVVTAPVSKVPAWVNKGSGAFNDNGQKIFYGVGAVSGIRNIALARTTCDNRARAEVSKVFETYTASLMKDYAASTTAGDMSKSSEEQHVEQAIKTVSINTLSGVEIVDHYEDKDTGTLYALAKLDLKTFSEMIGNASKELNSRVRDYVRKNAERMHEDLEKEEEKARERKENQ